MSSQTLWIEAESFSASVVERPEWRWQLGVGIIAIAQSAFDLGQPVGPWNDASFTRGCIGIFGLCLIYVAGFRIRFGTKGVIPRISSYKCPPTDIPRLLARDTLGLALIFTFLHWSNEKYLQVPEPFFLILLLVTILAALHTLYVWLVVSGILEGSEEEE